MVMKRRFVRVAFVLAVSVLSTALASGTAMAAELGDYLWKRRPLLAFPPSQDDPRLVETLSRIEASRCDFVDRDMVLGVVVAEGTSTLDGQDIDPDEAQRLTRQYAVGANVFTVVLIGKDGGEKFRVNDVPDLQRIYDLIDGMPMRGAEMRADPRRC
jgi:Domain of unknown function (DUF4174)